MQVLVLLVALLIVCSWTTLSVDGVTISLNGEPIPNNNISRRSVYDFEFVNFNVDFSKAMRCQSELMSDGGGTYGCHVGDGDTPVPCAYPDEEYIKFSGDSGFITRGWSGRRVDEDDHRVHYLWRRWETPEEGYINCRMIDDTNPLLGLYVLYPITEVTAAIEVEVGTLTFRVRCTSTGGRALNMAVSGPNGYKSDISTNIQPVGTPEFLNNDRYTARTGVISSGRDGDVFQCNVTSVTSTTSNVTVRVAAQPITSLEQTASTTVRVTWSPTLKPPESYRVHYLLAGGTGASGTETVSGNTTSTEITGLTNGETYIISVDVVSMLPGVIPAVSEEIITLAPDAPERVVVTAESASVRVSWNAVEDAEYTVTFSQVWGCYHQGLCNPNNSHTATLTVSAPSTTVSIAVGGDVESTVTDMLRAYTTYEVTVNTVSDVRGTSRPSETRRVLTPQTSAGEAPGDVRAETEIPTEISVQWSGLSNCRLINGRITQYRVQFTTNGRAETIDQVLGDGEDWMSGGRVTLTGLTSLTNYSISVAAVNENGDVGLYSDPLTLVTLQAIVGLAVTSYTVSESDEVVEVCINAVGTTSSCPSTESFHVTLSTSDQTAASPTDYVGVEEVLTFAACESQRCVNVRLANDLVSEPEETFSLSLTRSTRSHISITSATGVVVITDDDDSPAGVGFLPVNATGVRISWSGSVHLSTSIHYTVSLSTTGIIISQYDRVYPPGTTSDVVVLDDAITLTNAYVHNFTLYYIIGNDVTLVQGPPTNAPFTFDKTSFQIQFGPFQHCLDWGLKKIARTIEKQLQAYLIQIIREACSDCYKLAPSFLRPGLFLCHSNPTKTTYRSTLVNPFPTTNSTHLVGIIQSWVSTGPSLVLDGLLVRVSPACPTSISSLDEEECETGTTHDPQLGDRITQTLNVCALRNLGEEVCRLGGC